MERLSNMTRSVAIARAATAIGDALDRRALSPRALDDMARRGHPLADELADRLPAGIARRIPAELRARLTAWGEAEYEMVLQRLATTHPEHARVLRERWAYYVGQMERVKGRVRGD